MKKVLNVFLLMLPLALTIGCTPNIVREPEVITPPSNLLLKTPVPEYNVETYGDTFLYIEQAWSAIDSCNADKDSVRLFIEEAKKEKAP